MVSVLRSSRNRDSLITNLRHKSNMLELCTMTGIQKQYHLGLTSLAQSSHTP